MSDHAQERRQLTNPPHAQEGASLEKPLFIPLKAEYFDDFATGMKTTEYRINGPRWNERTCRIGRAVTLSRGYGKQQRLRGTVTGFIAEPLACLDGYLYRELRALFPSTSDYAKVACINIELESR
jgi:hypothetical protein